MHLSQQPCATRASHACGWYSVLIRIEKIHNKNAPVTFMTLCGIRENNFDKLGCWLVCGASEPDRLVQGSDPGVSTPN